MGQEKIILTKEDQDFAQKLAVFRKSSVDDILFCMSDPTIRPDFIVKARDELIDALKIVISAHNACGLVDAPCNDNRKYNKAKNDTGK